MRVSTRARYGLRFMLALARHRFGETVALGDVAQHEEISANYLWQVAALLKRAGLIAAVRGQKGGFYLRKRPEAISLREIFETLEGDGDLIDCLESPAACRRARGCTARSVWGELDMLLKERMEHMTLADISGREQAADPSCFDFVI